VKPKILIVEDQFIEAKSLNVILTNAGYSTCSIARSVATALSIIEKENPDLVLVDIFLQGEGTGIDLGRILNDRNMAFVYYQPIQTGRYWRRRNQPGHMALW